MGKQRSFEQDYESLQREVLYAQGQSWMLNLHGWNDRNQSIPICEWQGITCDEAKAELVVGIDLVGYNIAGPISPSIGMLSSLMHLNLSRNYLSGTIPSEIGSLPYLVTFKVNHNRLSGQIPHFVSSQLTEVNVSHNVLEGIHHFCEDHLNQRANVKDSSLNVLEILDASYNEMTGSIPEGFERLTQLHNLNLSFNKLYGTIPGDIGNLKDLKSLQLNDNNLIGTIPRSLTRGELSLVDLNLSNNDLSGTIPTGFSNIRYLENLQITGNKLTGSVPLPVCNLNLNQNLFIDEESDERNDVNEDVGIRNGCNSIACPTNSASKTGTYPCFECGDQGYDWYVGHVGKCLHLNEKILLDKIYDKTNGPMWREGTGWTLTNVDKCNYSGVECSTSGHVTAINLTDHGLSGPIPEEFGMFRYLESIDLSDNELTGFLPSDFRFLPLQHLDVTGNKLDGVVPPLLCLTGDINGNGANNDFNCDIISCPSGTWSPIGRATPTEMHNDRPIREYTCRPCQNSHSFLGSRFCGGALNLDSTENVKSFIHMDQKEFAAILTLPLIGAFAMVACATGFILHKRRQFFQQAHPDMLGKIHRRESLRHSIGGQGMRRDSLYSVDMRRDSMHSMGDQSMRSDSLYSMGGESMRRDSLYSVQSMQRDNSDHSGGGKQKRRDSFGNAISRRFNFQRQDTERTQDESGVHSSKSDWNYEDDTDNDDDDEDHRGLIASAVPHKKDPVTSNSLLAPDPPASASGFNEGDNESSGTSSQTGSKKSKGSRGSKNTLASKKAEKWLDVPKPE